MATALRVEAAVAGRKRAGTAEHTLDLDLPVNSPVPLRAIVDSVVRAEVQAFRRRSEEQRFVRVLTERALVEGVARGAVRSGGSETATEVDAEEAVAAALLAHEDGLYKVIVDDEPVDYLDTPVQLRPGSRLMFLRLVALAGG
ncbi:MAG: hypothetical protein QOI20_332 [Acidimicrobiaceae bacterium]|nr:hypothetical protein [Acidimicrobiaceae bacterium]